MHDDVRVQHELELTASDFERLVVARREPRVVIVRDDLHVRMLVADHLGAGVV